MARKRGDHSKSLFCRPHLECLEDRILLSLVTWVNPAGGDWDTPGNWSTGLLPAAGDDVVIDMAAIAVTHASGVSDAIHSLDTQADLQQTQ